MKIFLNHYHNISGNVLIWKLHSAKIVMGYIYAFTPDLTVQGKQYCQKHNVGLEPAR